MIFTISFEGPDGVGKFTQSKMLGYYFSKKGIEFHNFECPWPGHTFSYDLLQLMIKKNYASKFPTIFQIVHFVNKLALQKFIFDLDNSDNQETIKIIVLDRWVSSMYVYGRIMGVSEKLLNWMSKQLFRTDLEFLLDGTCKREKARDAIESNKALQENVRNLYRTLQKHENAVLVDADQSHIDIHNYVITTIQEKLISVLKKLMKKYKLSDDVCRRIVQIFQMSIIMGLDGADLLRAIEVNVNESEFLMLDPDYAKRSQEELEKLSQNISEQSLKIMPQLIVAFAI